MFYCQYSDHAATHYIKDNVSFSSKRHSQLSMPRSEVKGSLTQMRISL